ncbi:MAG: hypothetical protein AAF529_00135 [Pseudomonadota bacterium]
MKCIVYGNDNHSHFSSNLYLSHEWAQEPIAAAIAGTNENEYHLTMQIWKDHMSSGAIWARSILTIVCGYGLTTGLTGLLSMTLAIAGIAVSEAVFIATMLGILLYLTILLWGFADPNLNRVLTVTLHHVAAGVSGRPN